MFAHAAHSTDIFHAHANDSLHAHSLVPCNINTPEHALGLEIVAPSDAVCLGSVATVLALPHWVCKFTPIVLLPGSSQSPVPCPGSALVLMTSPSGGHHFATHIPYDLSLRLTQRRISNLQGVAIFNSSAR